MCRASRAGRSTSCRRAIDAARAEPGPSVIVATVEPHRLLSGTECFWDVGIFQASERAPMRALAEAHQEGQRTQRFFAHRTGR